MKDAISTVAYLAVIAAICCGVTACRTWIEEWNQHVKTNRWESSRKAREKLNRARANWELYLAEKHR